MSQSDTDGYQILNFRNFRIRIGYGYAKIFSYIDQELKNQYPLTSAAQAKDPFQDSTELKMNQRVTMFQERLSTLSIRYTEIDT